jgi:S1-C subfamily serine protease
MIPRFAILVVLAAAAMALPPPGRASDPDTTIAAAARKVVKIYGAGGLRGLEPYQTGILVAPNGHVLTVLSTVLDAEDIDCVLDDGTRYKASLLAADPRRDLAVLTIEAADLPAFALAEADAAPIGTRIFALSNLFGVAVGDERVSAQHGVVAAVMPLAARRGAYEVPFQGDVYVLDCSTNNPGSAGGAVVDWQGRLLGLLGKELREATSGTWLNYAIPAGELARAYRDIVSGTVPPAVADGPPVAFDTEPLGIVLVPNLLDKTPPFIDMVLPDSPAARAGLRPDDLVIAVAGGAVQSQAAVQRALAAIAEGDLVRLSVVRDNAVLDVDLGPRPTAPRQPVGTSEEPTP